MVRMNLRGGARRMAVLLLALALLGAAPLAAWAAKVTFLELPVQIKRKSTAAWVRLNVGDEVKEGDALRTGMGGRVEVTIAPKRVFRVGQASEVEVPSLEDKQGMKATMQVVGGRFWASLRTPLKEAFGEQFEVKTATATIGVKGTQFGVDYDKEQKTSSVTVVDGVVSAATPKQAGPAEEIAGPREIAPPEEISRDQWLVLVTRDQKVIMRPGEEPKVVPMTPEDKQDEFLLFNQERDRANDAGR
jgi:hypothetical protein